MYAAGLALLAVLCFSLGAYGAVLRVRLRSSCERLDRALARESGILEAARVITAASRDSSVAVLDALAAALGLADPPVDAVIVFTPDGGDLRCVFASGVRAAGYYGARISRDESCSPPARAAAALHRAALEPGDRALIPTDRSALAVPMAAGGVLAAVVYASSTRALHDPDVLARIVEQAAAPFLLAREREDDRAHATFDALTGLLTPRAFRNRLHEEVAVAEVSGRGALCLWFVDTDYFKRVNDGFGHAAGDLVLQRMAALLREHAPEHADVAARNGGDEFCAVLRGSGKVEAIERAQQFCRAVRECDFGFGVPITASIGVAAYPYDAQSANCLLEIADAAMYHSKRSGRDRVSFLAEAGAFATYE